MQWLLLSEKLWGHAMLKTFLCAMVCGSCVVGCGDSADSVANTTISSPGSTAAPSTTAPSTTASPARLVDEADLTTQTDTAYSLDWSVDGESLAVASGVEVTVLPSDLGEPISIFKPASGALAAAWSPEQKHIATVGGLRNRTIAIWDWESGAAALNQAQNVTADSDQFAVSWSPDGTRLATLTDDRTSTIQIWETNTWTLVHEFSLPYANPRRALNWSADGTKINDAGESKGQVVYFSMNVENGAVQELGALPLTSASVVAFSPDSQSIAVADEAGSVQILAVASGATLAAFQSVKSPVDLAWNPKNSTLAVLGYDTSLQLWALAV